MTVEEASEPQPVLSDEEVQTIAARLGGRWQYHSGDETTDWQTLESDVLALIQSIEILRHMASVTKIRGPKWKNHVLVRLDSRQGYKGNRLNWRYRYRCRCGVVGTWWQCEKENPTAKDLAFGGQDQARLEFDAHLKEVQQSIG